MRRCRGHRNEIHAGSCERSDEQHSRRPARDPPRRASVAAVGHGATRHRTTQMTAHNVASTAIADRHDASGRSMTAHHTTDDVPEPDAGGGGEMREKSAPFTVELREQQRPSRSPEAPTPIETHVIARPAGTPEGPRRTPSRARSARPAQPGCPGGTPILNDEVLIESTERAGAARGTCGKYDAGVASPVETFKKPTTPLAGRNAVSSRFARSSPVSGASRHRCRSRPQACRFHCATGSMSDAGGLPAATPPRRQSRVRIGSSEVKTQTAPEMTQQPSRVNGPNWLLDRPRRLARGRSNHGK